MRLRHSFFFLIVALLPARLLALGIRIADQDPFATARGNAFAATADNPSAIYYNPAGITQLEGQNASYSLYAIYLNSHYTSPSGTEVDTKDEIQAVPHLYYTYSMEKLPLSFGLGVYSPYGLGLEWPVNGPFNALATEGRIMYFTANPVAAVKILPTLSVAAGVTINYSQAELKRGLGFAPGEFKFKGDDTDVGYNIGLLWQPHPMHSFGVSYRSSTTMNFSGHAQIPNFREEATASFRFPHNVVVGWSFRPTTNWNFEVNVDWTDWDALDTVNLKANVLGTSIPFNWQSSFFYEFGATYQFDNGFRLSGGYIYSENSVPESSFSPAVPDSDRHIFSLGAGMKYKRLSWDAAYQLAYGPPRDIRGTFGGLADGRYEFISHAITVSLGYAF
ncbi:MAG TPA: outer membrane protein transport protein [Candidatus Angelobacter sp.]|nr:outer membrane protein transport protein [Candidatus Angelobacter sp.]